MNDDTSGYKLKESAGKIPLQRLVMLFLGQWRYVNYNKKFPKAQCWNSWKPTFNRYWMGDIWELGCHGHYVSVDMRSDWVADMINQGRKRHIRTVWTCCNFCHIEHRFKFTAWLHGRWIYIKREVFKAA